MKTFLQICSFCLFIGLISSCTIDVVKKEINSPGLTPTISWAGRDTVHCITQNSFEHDLIAMLHDYDLNGVDTILRTEIGNTHYDDVKEQILIASDIGVANWYTQYVGTSPSRDLMHELDSIRVFFELNYSSNYFASLVDSLINDYIIDNRFDIEEKNLLATYALTLSSYWEVAKCKEKNFQVRNGDDGRLCNFTENCELADLALGAAAGAVVGYVIEFVQKEFWFGSGNGVVTAVFSLFGAYLFYQIDPLDCYECDDCHHPEFIRYSVDFTHCRISSATFFGSFEFAEDWEWDVEAQSGNFSGHNTLQPRAFFPVSFDPGGFPWQMTVRTVCDGDTYADNDNIGTVVVFDGKLPQTPLSIRGSAIADRVRDFTYQTSSTFNGHLHDATWSASEDVEILDDGFENGNYYVIVNFSEVTTTSAEITVNIYDDCHEDYIEETKIIRLDHE